MEYVYLLRSGQSYNIKVGFTRELPTTGTRSKSLQTGNPEELTLMDYLPVPDGRQVESRLLETYQRSALTGEWIDLSDERTRNHFSECWNRLRESFSTHKPLFS
jgi:hypothetical protein